MKVVQQNFEKSLRQLQSNYDSRLSLTIDSANSILQEWLDKGC